MNGILMTVMAPLILMSGESPTVVSPSDWSSVLSALTAQISVSTVVGVIAAVIAAAIGLVFMWFGVRKLVRGLMAAFRKGKLSV